MLALMFVVTTWSPIGKNEHKHQRLIQKSCRAIKNETLIVSGLNVKGETNCFRNEFKCIRYKKNVLASNYFDL